MEEKVRGILVRVCRSDEVLLDDVDLLDSGLLDSLALIELFDELEQAGITLLPTQVSRDQLRTVKGICEAIENQARHSPN